jgi:hypothetical protein
VSAKPLIVSVLFAGSLACAPPSRPPVAGVEDEAPRVVNRDRNVITQAELDADRTLKGANALDAIHALRPQFFVDRGIQTIRIDESVTADPEAGKVHASVNGGRVILIDDLKDVHANEMIEVRFLNPAQAMQKFGTAARSGPVILVTTTNQ